MIPRIPSEVRAQYSLLNSCAYSDRTTKQLQIDDSVRKDERTMIKTAIIDGGCYEWVIMTNGHIWALFYTEMQQPSSRLLVQQVRKRLHHTLYTIEDRWDLHMGKELHLAGTT